MEIIRLGSQPSVKGPEDWFTSKACFQSRIKWVSNFIL